MKKINITKISLLYLLIPNIIFIFGYYKLFISIPAIFFLILLFLIKSNNTKKIPILINKELIIGFILIILWSIISGIFPQIYQNGDWFKHNSILFDLVEKKWPVSYGNNNLIYYIGYYLPAALIGKIINLKIAKLSLAIWTLIGTTLIYLYITKNTKNKIKKTLFFIFFGGMNFVIYFLTNKNIVSGTDQSWYTIVEWLYLPNSTALFQNIQQAICGWLSTLILLDEMKSTKILNLLPFIMVLNLILSPFITLGLIIFIPFFLKTTNIKKIFSLENIFLLAITLIILLFYKSSSFNNSDFYFVPFRKNLLDLWPRFILSYLCYLGIFIPIIFSKTIFNKKIFIISIIFLLILPMFHYGACNDIVMKSSIPALLVAQLFLYQNIRFNKNKCFILIIFLLSATSSISEISHTLKLWGKEKKAYTSITENQGIIVEQYLGKLNNFIFK